MIGDIEVSFGESIKKLREEMSISQRELASELFISYQLVSKWERGICDPTLDMIMFIVNKYDLPLNYFIDKENFTDKKESIMNALVETMMVSSDQMPTFLEISQISGVSQRELSAYFQTPEALMYRFIVMVDQNIQREIKWQIANSDKSIMNIFLYDMTPLLFKRRVELHLLYTRPYINGLWFKFITKKYKQILLHHHHTHIETDLDMDYLIGCLTSFITVWMSQDNPEPLVIFQNRVKKIMSRNMFEDL